MKHLLRLAVLFGCLVIPSAVLAADDDYLGGFEGRWEGALKSIPAESFDSFYGGKVPNTPFRVALSIKDQAVTVFENSGNGWEECKPGHFQLLAYKSNAIVSAIDSSNTGPAGGWVETWNFTITHKDRDSLLVTMARTVNNYQRAPDYQTPSTTGRFFDLMFGDMKKVSQ